MNILNYSKPLTCQVLPAEACLIDAQSTPILGPCLFEVQAVIWVFRFVFVLAQIPSKIHASTVTA